MLTSDMAEVAKHEIQLDYISKNIIQIILDYMYCENVSFYKDQLMDLIAAADYLQMMELKQMGLDEVPNIMEPANVISWWKEAAKMNYDTIKDQCEEMMVDDFQQISQQIDFLNLDLNEMNLYVLDICNDTVNSDDTVDALLRWVCHEDERVALLEDLLHKFQLNKCSEEGIKIVVNTHEALLNKAPIVYKLLFNRSAVAKSDTPEIMTDSVVVVGGRETNNVNEVCWKVSQSDEFVKLCDIPVDELGLNHSVCIVPQGFVVSGGAGSDMCIMFITSSSSWLRMHDMLTMRQCHGTICVKQVLYVLGGFVGNYSEDSRCTDSVDSMAMERGKWQNGPGLPFGVDFPKVSNLDDRVYLLDQSSSQLLCLDIDKGVWHTLAPLPGDGSCTGVSMASARRQLFVAGGLGMFCCWYTPETNTWHNGQQPLREHTYAALTYHRDKLVLLGGNLGDGTGTDEVEEYNIEEDKWSVCSYKLKKMIHLHHAVVLRM